MTQGMPKRSEVATQETWDVSLLFETKEAYEQELKMFSEDLEQFTQTYKGHINSAEKATQALTEMNQLMKRMSWLTHYAFLPVSVDATDEVANQNYLKLEPVNDQYSVAWAFLTNELYELSDEVYDQIMEAFDATRPFFRQLLNAKAHRLDPIVEETLADMSSVLNTRMNDYETTKFKDMTFDSFEVDGKTYPNSYVLFENDYEMDANPAIRYPAYESFHRTLRQHMHTTANNYINHVKMEKKMATMRGFDSVIDYLLSEQEVSQVEFNRQLDVIMKELAPVMRRYAQVIKKAYKIERLSIRDVKLSLGKEAKRISIDEAKEQLKIAFNILGEDYVKMIEKSFEERWIDFPQNVGKSTGGFCATVYQGPSYILLSWTGLMNELLVLAHELGHAGHFQNAYASQEAIVPEASLYNIEAPSTANEVIMCQYLLAHEKDAEQRRTLIADFISRTYFHNMVTHLLEAYFQREIYRLVDQQEYLDAETLNKLFKEILEMFWGPDVDISEGAELTWMRQPHYYMGLYPYTYSAGLTLGTQVGLKLSEHPEEYREKWLNVLSQNGRVTPMEFAQAVDVDMTTDQPLRDTIKYVESLVEELEKI
ncbi:oligoendopeptidase F [Atopobacter phocae]|uniref:oligoendopeptidase F n=1 Tax=Atopobacter phocae TaxID=136492 RepID=UPI00046F43C1|nr:oligoendopeptidase F [Atopobacter phocae]